MTAICITAVLAFAAGYGVASWRRFIREGRCMVLSFCTLAKRP